MRARDVNTWVEDDAGPRRRQKVEEKETPKRRLSLRISERELAENDHSRTPDPSGQGSQVAGGKGRKKRGRNGPGWTVEEGNPLYSVVITLLRVRDGVTRARAFCRFCSLSRPPLLLDHHVQI